MDSQQTEQEIRALMLELERRKEREIYLEKGEYLKEKYPFIEPMDFYRDVFPKGSFERKGKYDDRKGNGIAVDLSDIKNPRRYVVTDEHEKLEELIGKEFVIFSPICYNGRNRTSANARHIFGITFDLDGVGLYQLKNLLHQADEKLIPKPTYVINSGMGVHLYYLFREPMPAYPDNQRYLKELKYALTRRIWNDATSTIKEPQYQTIAQGFRMVGTAAKLGKEYPVAAYKTGEKVTAEELFSYIPETSGERKKILSFRRQSHYSLSEARTLFPDWYNWKILNQGKKSRWHVKKDLYIWYLRRCREEIRVGHRYFGIMVLAIYARKCDVPYDELEQDAFDLLEHFDKMTVDAKNHFTEDDVVAALALYDENYVTFPRDDIAKITGLNMPVNKRNGRNKHDHLKRARALRDVDHPDGSWRNKDGAPTKKHIVEKYMRENPEARKIDVIRNTGISKPTVYKYYDTIRKNLEK